jgi:hypothetical protein
MHSALFNITSHQIIKEKSYLAKIIKAKGQSGWAIISLSGSDRDLFVTYKVAKGAHVLFNALRLHKECNQESWEAPECHQEGPACATLRSSVVCHNFCANREVGLGVVWVELDIADNSVGKRSSFQVGLSPEEHGL